MRLFNRLLTITVAVIMLLGVAPISMLADGIAQIKVQEGIGKTNSAIAEDQIGDVPQDADVSTISDVPGTVNLLENDFDDTVPVWDGTTAADFGGGTGTESNPYEIENGAQLAYLSKQVNEGTSYAGAFFKLTADIALNDTSNYANWYSDAPANSWIPIGTFKYVTSETDSFPFAGTFDGDGHTVKGVYVRTAVYDAIGLFGYVTGSIKNMTSVDAYCFLESNPTLYSYAGGLVGRLSSGTITHCYANGRVYTEVKGVVSGETYNSYSAGLVGEITDSTVSDCYANVYLRSDYLNYNPCSFYSFLGGLVGRSNNSSISNCYSTSSVNDFNQDSSASYDGGLVGYSSGTVLNCYATGDLSSNKGYMGGLVGYNVGTITKSYATGTVNGIANISGDANYLGGLVGYNSGVITKSYATGSVDGKASIIYSGGLVGSNGGSITGCYSTGNVNSSLFVTSQTAYRIGGHVGENEETGTITNCFATGNVMATVTASDYWYIGGVVGINNDGTITNCYRCKDQTIMYVSENYASNSIGATATLSQLQSASYCLSAMSWPGTEWKFSDGAFPSFRGEIVDVTSSNGIKYTLYSDYTADVGDARTGGSNNSGYNEVNDGSVVTDDTIDYLGHTYTVTSICANAFSECTMLKSITIGNNVEIIGVEAFLGCTGLSAIIIPEAVKTIGKTAFSNCVNLSLLTVNATKLDDFVPSLVSFDSAGINAGGLDLVFGNTATSVPACMFYNCPVLTSATLYDGINNVGDDAFNGSGLHRFFVTGNAPTVGSNSFGEQVPQKNIVYYTTGTSGWTTPVWNGYGCYPNEAMTGDITQLDENCTNSLGLVFTLNLQAKTALVGTGTDTKNNSGYLCANLGNCIIPETVVKDGITYTVTGIGANAFSGNSGMCSISIPKTVLSLGDNALNNCQSLEKIVVDSSNSRFASENDCVLFNKSKSILYTYAPACKNASYTIPDDVYNVKEGAFAGTRYLNHLIIPFTGGSSVASTANESTLFGYIFGKEAFDNSVAVKQSYGTAASEYATYYLPKMLTEITVSDNLLYGAFYNCKTLMKVTVTSDVTDIASHAFSGCLGLTSITLPFVGANADVQEDSELTRFGYIFGTTPYTGGMPTVQIGEITYYIPSALTDITLTGGKLPYGAFYDCDMIERVTLHSNLERVGEYAFYNCGALVEVNYGDTTKLTDIGSNAFYMNAMLSNIVIPETCVTIGESAFRGCSAAKKILIPKSVESIGSNAFYGCTNVTSVEIESGSALTTITSFAFTQCTSLKDFNVDTDGMITSIATNAFSGCALLADFSIPAKVTSIGQSAFNGCSSLKNLVIPPAVTSISTNAFNGCTSLETITLGAGLTNLTGFYLSSYTKLKEFRVSEDNDYYAADRWGVLHNKDLSTLVCYPQNSPWPYYNIAKTVTSISDNAFINNENLINVLALSSVTNIGVNNFVTCQNMCLIVFSGSAALAYASENNINFDLIDSLEVSSIEVLSAPYNTVYVIGTEFDFTGLYVVGLYGVFTLQLDEYTLEYDPNLLGMQNVTVRYGSMTDTFEIEIKDRTLTGMEIVSLPKGLTFLEGVAGQDLNTEGLIIKGYYDNGTTDPVVGYTVTGYDKDKIGWQTVSITCSGISVECDVFVYANEVASIEITTMPNKFEYFRNENLDPTGLVVTANYKNGTSEPIADYMIVGFVSSALGEVTVSVFHGSYKADFTVTIIKDVALSVPAAPTVENRTDTTVTLVAVQDVEYSKDGIDWQVSNIFDELLPHSQYTFYMRYAETDDYQPSAAGEGLTIMTKYTLEGSAGISGNVQDGNVEIGNTIGVDMTNIKPTGAQVTYQWCRDGEVIPGQTAASYLLVPADIGHAISVILTGVDEYYGTVMSSAITAIKNTVPAPAAPLLVEVTDTTIEVVADSRYQYSMDLVIWSTNNVFVGLSPNTEYRVYQRFAETATTSTSAPSAALIVTTMKTALTDIPTTPTVESVTNNTVVLTRIEGYEYSYTGSAWQSSNIFTGLEQNTNYTFYQRVAETENTYAGPASAGLTVKTAMNEYTVQFVDWDGTVIKSESVRYGEAATAPADPIRAGHTFTGWNGDYSRVISSLTITAQYDINTYTVTFVDGHTGETLSTVRVEYGSDVTMPTPPEHTGYHFVGWDNDGENISDDTTITALYEINVYTVTFVDGHTGETISTAQVEHGSDATFPTPPEHVGYHFASWDSDGTNITAATTITAGYAINVYTVTFVDGHTGETISTVNVEHGSNVEFPTVSEYEGYHFTSWDNDGTNITDDTTITALYAINVYTVTFVDGHTGETISTAQVEHGADATFPTPPEHVGYHFTTWNSDGTNITADTTITASYAINVYTVTFVDGYTGETISTVSVEHGSDVELPTHEEYYGYTFTGWSHSGKSITGDITITALYEINVYTVTFVDDHTGEIISIALVEHGSDATFPTPPEHDGYTFIGWSNEGKNVTMSLTIVAQYEKTIEVGDVNGDGNINTGDVVVILRQSVGLIEFTEEQMILADYNGDGVVNTGDAVSILKYCVGLANVDANPTIILGEDK